MEQKRQFTGVWIPRHIVEDNRLNWTERALYAEISCYDECFASNAFFAKRLDVSEKRISTMLSHLIELGYIIWVSFDGRKRVITSSQTRQKCLGRPDKNEKSDQTKMSSIDNNIENKVDPCKNEFLQNDDEAGDFLVKTGKASKYEAEINKIMGLFQEVNDNYTLLYQNKTERANLSKLLDIHPVSDIQTMLKFASNYNKDPKTIDAYKIYTPLNLVKNWSRIKDWYISNVIKEKKGKQGFAM